MIIRMNLKIVSLAPLFFTFMIQTAHANTASTIAALKATIQAQQIQLAKQAKALQNEQQLLGNLTKRVDKLSVKSPSAPAHSVEPTQHITETATAVTHPTHAQETYTTSTTPGLVRVRTVSPSQDSVIRQASAPENVVSVAGQELILGSKKSYISISGQISALGFQAADGKFNRTYLGTNTISDDRLSINSKMKISPDLKVGSQLQLGFDTNPSATTNQFTPNSSSINIRRAEVFLKSKTWGSVYFGQGETASDNTAYVDFSGTAIVGRASVNDIGGGLYFNGLQTNPRVNDVFVGLDGFSRKFRVLYDTPAFHGFEIGGSLISGSRSDVALKYGNKFGGTKVAAEVAYTSPQDVGTAVAAHGNEMNGSVSVLLPVGISLTGAGGGIRAKSATRNNPDYFYIKPGYQFNYFNTGLTALSVDFGRYYNFNQNGDKAISVGVEAVQNVDKFDMALYATYRRFALSDFTTSYHDINLFAMGLLYKF